MNQDIGNSYSSKDTKTKLSITYNKIRSQTKLLAKKLTLDDLTPPGFLKPLY